MERGVTQSAGHGVHFYGADERQIIANVASYISEGLRAGDGVLVVSRGVGTSFLPFRLFTRPEATLWRLVYTSDDHPGVTNSSNEGGADDAS